MTQSGYTYLIPSGRYSVCEDSTRDPIALLMASRLQILGRSSERLEGLLGARDNLKEEALASIDKNRLTVANLIHALYLPGQKQTDNPLYIRLKLEELRLDRDQRMEVIGAWRDGVELCRELGGLAEKIEMAGRNERILGGDLL